jgi:uncharacterized protein (TIGR02001 family)
MTNKRMAGLALGIALAIGSGFGSASAQDATESMFDVAFGATLTSDYMSRGTTQTDGGPAIQGYIEGDYAGFYVGGFISNVDYGFDDTEIDAQVGWRPELGDFGFDFGYIHYFYIIDTGSNYGEFYAQTSYSANDWLTVGGKVYYAPDYVQTDTSAVYGEGNAEVALPWDFSLSGALGYQDFEEAYGSSYWTWNAGVSWTWRDAITLDVRYWDTDLTQDECAGISTRRNSCDARVVASISFDTSWRAFQGALTATGN